MLFYSDHLFFESFDLQSYELTSRVSFDRLFQISDSERSFEHCVFKIFIFQFESVPSLLSASTFGALLREEQKNLCRF